MHKHGQSLLELSIFGAFIIMLLGLLLNYGLKYNFQQQVDQRAFRRALSYAASSNKPGQPITAASLIVKHRHIPDPQDAFGFGKITSFAGGDSVTRNPESHKTADGKNELPTLEVDFDGTKSTFKTAAYRSEIGRLIEEPLDKYREIYSISNLFLFGAYKGDTMYSQCLQCCNIRWSQVSDRYCSYWDTVNILTNPVGSVTRECVDRDANGVCLDCREGVAVGNCGVRSTCDPNQSSGRRPSTGSGPRCFLYMTAMKITDSCIGEVIDYDGAYRQCQMLTVPAVCQQECERGRVPFGNYTRTCEVICNENTNPPNQYTSVYREDSGGAWYCADYYDDPSTNIRVYPKLAQLFRDTYKGKTMGLQQDTTELEIKQGVLDKKETTNYLVTNQTASLRQQEKKAFRYAETLNETGYSVQQATGTINVPISSDTIKPRKESWNTTW